MKLKLSKNINPRLIIVILGVFLITAIVIILFLTKRPIKIPPYTATYQVNTQINFGDVYNYQTEKVIVSQLNGFYKSERFVNDIALLESTYNNKDGFFLCSQNDEFDCKRLGDTLTKNVGKPPKIEGLKISSSIAKTVYVSGGDRPCHETTYTLSAASDKNASIQDITATVCLDDKFRIPLEASFTARYHVNDITEIKSLTIKQTRTLTDLNTTPNLSPSDFTAPTAN